jgi:16S rRNA (cytosine967-C5)-methyltransferase
MGVYMIYFMDIANHFVVNELVKIVKKHDYHASGMVNAILRSIIRDGLREIKINDKAEYLSVKYSYSLELVRELIKQYPDKIEEILSNEEEVYNTYRINTLKISLEEVETLLKEQDIAYKLEKTTLWTKNSLINTSLFLDGKIVAQDASSQEVALVANPLQGSKILDACSAPGGKACHMATIMKNQGDIICLDVYPHKLKLIEENALKQGLTILKPTLADARMYQSDCDFDYVVIDAPCSGLGVMLHKVDLKYHMTLSSMNELVLLQEEILENLYKLVKVNGYLVYSTCTINKNENNYQIKKFVKKHPEFVLLEEKEYLPSSLGDGFYIAKLQRKA